jgi:UDP-3-O-[3-hydroxymyristoyl] glucosamine N-acyltransferase
MLFFPPESVSAIALRLGGVIRDSARRLSEIKVDRIAPVHLASAGAVAPVLRASMLQAARDAHERGAVLLVAHSLSRGIDGWIHPHAPWAMAELLDRCLVEDHDAVIGEGSRLGPNVVLGPRVVIGKNVTIGANSVIGRPGFGWAFRGDEVRAIPQLGGVLIEDDVVVGPLSSIDAGTLGPTRLRRGVKLDAQVHVAHNCDIGENTIVAAQSGFAGSVIVGRGVLVGGQAGFADHVSIGDGARIAAKSGVIGDVPAGATVAGYPAVPRIRWLRALAQLYRGRIEPPPE